MAVVHAWMDRERGEVLTLCEGHGRLAVRHTRVDENSWFEEDAQTMGCFVCEGGETS